MSGINVVAVPTKPERFQGGISRDRCDVWNSTSPKIKPHDPAGRLQAVDLRHFHIHQHQVAVVSLQFVDHFGAVLHDAGLQT